MSMEERHYLSEPRPVKGLELPTWEVDVLREGVPDPILTVLIDAKVLPPRRRKKKIVWKLPDTIQQLPKFGKEDKGRILELFKQQKKALKREKRKSQQQQEKEKGTDEETNNDNPQGENDNIQTASPLGAAPPPPPPGIPTATATTKTDGDIANHQQPTNSSTEEPASISSPPSDNNMKSASKKNKRRSKENRNVNGNSLPATTAATTDPPPKHKPTPSVTTKKSTSVGPPPGLPAQSASNNTSTTGSTFAPPQPPATTLEENPASTTNAPPPPPPGLAVPPHASLQPPPTSQPTHPLPTTSARYFEVAPNANLAHLVIQSYYGLLTQGRVQELQAYYASSAAKSLTVGGAHAVCHSAQDVLTQLQSLAGMVVHIRGVLQQATCGKGTMVIITGMCVQPHSLPFCHSLVLIPSAHPESATTTLGYQIQNDALCFLTTEDMAANPTN